LLLLGARSLVGVEAMTCDPAGVVGGDEGDDVGDVAWLTDAVECRQRGRLRFRLFAYA
jgi:hypothetical protein